MSFQPRRIGFAHVPKTAGTAIGFAISKSLGLERRHFFKADLAGLRKSTPAAHAEIAKLPFISGHVSPKQLRACDRDFIFTVLRDPRVRLVSEYAYLRAYALKRDESRLLPHELAAKQLSLLGWLETRAKSPMTRFLINLPKRDRQRTEAELNARREPDRILQKINRQLSLLDGVYACDPALIMHDLFDRGVIPKAVIAPRNVTNKQSELLVGGDKDFLLETLALHTRIDTLLYNEAAQLYPATVTKELLSDEDVIDTMLSRYGFEFR